MVNSGELQRVQSAHSVELKKDTSIHRWVCLPHWNQHGKEERKWKVFISSGNHIYSLWWEHIHSTDVDWDPTTCQALFCVQRRVLRGPLPVCKDSHIPGACCRSIRAESDCTPQARWTSPGTGDTGAGSWRMSRSLQEKNEEGTAGSKINAEEGYEAHDALGWMAGSAVCVEQKAR